jgi:hypothetical protein
MFIGDLGGLYFSVHISLTVYSIIRVISHFGKQSEEHIDYFGLYHATHFGVNRASDSGVNHASDSGVNRATHFGANHAILFC